MYTQEERFSDDLFNMDLVKGYTNRPALVLPGLEEEDLNTAINAVFDDDPKGYYLYASLGTPELEMFHTFCLESGVPLVIRSHTGWESVLISNAQAKKVRVYYDAYYQEYLNNNVDEDAYDFHSRIPE